MFYGPFPRLKVDGLLSVQTPAGPIVPHGILSHWTRDIYHEVRLHPCRYVDHRWFFRIDDNGCPTTFLVTINPWLAHPYCLLFLRQTSGPPLSIKAIGCPVQLQP